MKLSKNDYKSILNYYKINSDNSTPLQIKNAAESILATKLCRCIKKVDPTLKNESTAIAICTNSILKKKHLKSFRFTCKKKVSFLDSQTQSGTKLIKTKRKLHLRPRK
jgi:hypothetical protein